MDRTAAYDTVVLDVMPPGLDGWAVDAGQGEAEPHPALLFVSPAH